MAANLVALREKMKAELASVRDSVAPPSGFNVSVKGKKFTFPDGSVNEGPIDVVILDWRNVNTYYTGAYNPNAPKPPVCFSILKSLKDMKPSQNAPQKQHDTCHGCPKNEWGSDPQGGRGKACKNSARLAIVPADASLESPVWTLNVSPKGLGSFNAFVNKLADQYGMLPIEVVCSISFDANEAYPKLIFGEATQHDNLDVMLQLRETSASILEKEPDLQ